MENDLSTSQDMVGANLISYYQGRAWKTRPGKDREIIKIHSNFVALGLNVSSRTV